MKKAYITIGVSASGKTTWTNQFLKNHEMLFKSGKSSGVYCNINFDEIRALVLVEMGITKSIEDFSWDLWNLKYEKAMSKKAKHIFDNAVTQGYFIILSNTNVNKDNLIAKTKELESLGYSVEWVYFDISYDEALKRDAGRKNGVGAYVIRKQWKNYLELKNKSFVVENAKYISSLGSVQTVEPYVFSDEKTEALMFDIDGTIANMVDRKAYDWDKVGQDKPDFIMQILIDGWLSLGKKIVFMSGRDGQCYQETKEWILKYFSKVDFDKEKGNSVLFMREHQDMRKDYVIKKEIFDNKVRDSYNIVAVFDDRPQVVRMWHDLGLKVWSTGDQLIDF